MHVPKVALRITAIALFMVAALGGAWYVVRAQSSGKPPYTKGWTGWKMPPRPAKECCGYPFPRETDAEIADGGVHIVHYEDSHVMLMEVANAPLLDVKMHGHPFASVFSHDSTTGPKNPDAPPPSGLPTQLDPGSSFNDMGSTDAPGPNGQMWPNCTPAAPQAPHRPFNANLAPNHFYRMEYLRLDGNDLAARWKEWYPELAKPVPPVKDLVPGPALGPKFSAEWPYPIAYDSIQAAPNNFKLRYENDKIRMIEAIVRPGETTPMYGTPYSHTMSFDSTSLLSKDITDKFLDPKSPLNGQGAGQGHAPKTQGLTQPTCTTMAARAPHALHNAGTTPLHYYMLEFKRIDGDGLTTHWKEWYPWMQYMQSMRE